MRSFTLLIAIVGVALIALGGCESSSLSNGSVTSSAVMPSDLESFRRSESQPVQPVAYDTESSAPLTSVVSTTPTLVR